MDSAAYPVTVDPTTQVINLSAGGVGLGSQRNTFYDARPGYERWWVVYSNGTYIRSSYSTNGTSWAQSGQTGWPTVDSAVYLSTWFDGAGSVYAAYRKTNTHAIYVRKGTVNTTTIVWGAEYTALGGTSSTNSYTYPSISQATNGRLWIAARWYNGSTYRVRARLSTNAYDVSSWQATIYDVSGGTSSAMVVPQIIQLPGSKMYAIYLYGSAIRGKLWAPGSWGTESAITSTYTADVDHVPSGIVRSGGAIVMGYADTGRNIKYRTLASPYTGSWSGANTLASDTGENVVLTDDLSTNKYYAFYAALSGSNRQIRQVKEGEPNTKLNLSSTSYNRDQVTTVRSTSGKSYVVFREVSTFDIYFDRVRTLPVTSYSISPSTPNGDNGWYKTNKPTITLTHDQPAATTKYKWNTDSWVTYSSPFANAPEGNNTLYYYSYDPLSNTELEKNKPGIKVDTTNPTNPTLASPTHTVDATSSLNTITMDFPGAADAASGVDGFSFEWSQAAGTVPDTVKDLEENVSTTTSDLLTPGSWYFHLRTKDNAGNWSSAIHKGPYHIEVPLGLESYSTAYVEQTNAGNLTVDLLSGNLVADVAGLSRPARGLPVSFAHTYNSKSDQSGPYGYGWTINYAQRLETETPRV